MKYKYIIFFMFSFICIYVATLTVIDKFDGMI